MGMFDTIRVHHSIDLPDFPDDEIRSFQTKNIDKKLDVYEITQFGTLILVGEYEGQDYQSTREYKDYHGRLDFYTDSILKDKWYEYTAKFVHGRIVDITRKVSK